MNIFLTKLEKNQRGDQDTNFKILFENCIICKKRVKPRNMSYYAKTPKICIFMQNKTTINSLIIM
jgi:hypothetical protein